MSTATQPEAKRKRTNETESSAEPLLQSELWFHDGNIVLQAGRTQFKVYQGLLSANSAVFADMFLVPQPSSGGENVDGCPLVHLSDSAIDVTYVLEALCKRRYVTVHDALPFEIIAAFVRLGQKYQIDAVLSEGLRRLYYEFPVELADYDINDNWSRISKEGGNDILMDIANLAREQNLLSILPLALHCCSSEEYSDAIAKGIKREDQTVATLSPVNERAVWAASHPLLRIQTTTTYAWLLAFRSDDSCADEDDCENARAHIARRSFFPVSTQHDCLSPWDEDWEEDLCSACVSKAQTIHSAGRQSYWNQLPSIFDLPDWEELKKDRLLSTI